MKNKLLTPIMSLGVACIAIAPIVAITSCSCQHIIPEPIPSKHGFDVEGKDYKIQDDDTVSFKITCQEKDNHNLSNITLYDGETKLSSISSTKEMKNGELNVTFSNVTLATDSTNNAKITFIVDDSSDIEEISRITISKNIQPGPQPTEDFIVSGIYDYQTPDSSLGNPVKPDDYVNCELQEINFYDMADWYANASTDTSVVGKMIAFDMVCIPWIYGDPSSKYHSEVTYNFTQQRMNAIVETEKIEGGETKATFKCEIVNAPYWLNILIEGNEAIPAWAPIGSMETGFIELWSYDDWSIKITRDSETIVEVNQDLFSDQFDDVSPYTMGPCFETFKDVKIKPFMA